MFDIVVVVVVVVVFFLGEDTKGSVVVTGSSSTTTMVARNNRWDNRVPFPHVHKMEMVEMSIPIPELTKLPRPVLLLLPAEEMDLANSRIMDEMTVNMTWDHQLIQEVRESVLEICRIKMVNLVVGTTVLPLLLLLSTTALDGILVARCSEW